MINPQPILRWAGGKRQLLEILLSSYPKDFDPHVNNYFEPFVGGGALFFSLASNFEHVNFSTVEESSHHFFLSDTNDELINFYKVVRDKPKLLIKRVNFLANQKSEKDFYRVRESAPRSETARAARLLYLNRLCFNGLYRVNSRGLFNVPFGRLKNPVICNSDLIFACSAWLQKAEISTMPFQEAVKKAKQADLVYFDPPYIPMSNTASFSSYAKEDFDMDDQQELAHTIFELSKKGVRVILSNSDTARSREIFGSLNLFSVSANRSISASGTSRVRVQELIGTNFPLSEMRDGTKLASNSII